MDKGDENIQQIDANHDKAPVIAKILVYASTLPFIGLLGAWLAFTPRFYHAFLAEGIMLYAAICLSFMSAIRWGLALASISKSSRDRIMLLSVLPCLLGWLTVWILPPQIAMLVFACLFAIVGVWDSWDTDHFRYPSWYASLRIRVTLILTITLSLLAMMV